MKKVYSTVLNILVILFVAFAVLVVGLRFAGFQIFSVLSGSMEPTYHVGSLVYVKPVEANTLQVGDPITFMVNEDTVVTHRIVDIIPDEEDPTVLRFETQGDANIVPDSGLVHYKNVVGKVVFTIPYLGYVADFVKQPPGLYFAIGFAVLLLLLEFLPDLLFPEEKKKKVPSDSDGHET